MKKSLEGQKMLDLFACFERNDWQRFEEFLHSPFFNKKKVLLSLYSNIRQHRRVVCSTSLSNSARKELLLAGTGLSATGLNHWCNYLLQLIEKYLVQKAFEANPLLGDLKLLEFYRDHHLDKHYRFKKKQVEKKLQVSGELGEQYLFDQMRLAEIENAYFVQQKKGVRDEEAAIERADQALDAFYVLKKLRLMAELIDRKNRYDLNWEQAALRYSDHILEHNGFEHLALVRIYRQLLRMLEEDGEEQHFFAYTELLRTRTADIAERELRNLYLFAINYAVRKIAAGKPFHQHLLELYRIGLEKEILLESGYLSHWTYKNVVLLGLALEREEWVARFITEYADLLSPGFREDAYHYNLAVYHYSRKDYDQAMGFLNRVQYSDLVYKLWSKELLLKIYFELDEFGPLFSLLFSFEQFLNRHREIPKKQKKAFRNFLRMLTSLVRGRVPKTRIREKINQAELIRERQWLLLQCGDNH